MWFQPKIKPEEWEDRAPNITMSGKAGSWTAEKMIKYLSLGGKGKGQPPDAPMPSYKMTPADARAVTAYLRSLKGAQKGKDENGRKGKKKKEREDDDDD
jgi:hypothetical protein